MAKVVAEVREIRAIQRLVLPLIQTRIRYYDSTTSLNKPFDIYTKAQLKSDHAFREASPTTLNLVQVLHMVVMRNARLVGYSGFVGCLA
jgi:hypothetical protein